jgi:hypothetical protein
MIGRISRNLDQAVNSRFKQDPGDLNSPGAIRISCPGAGMGEG